MKILRSVGGGGHTGSFLKKWMDNNVTFLRCYLLELVLR